MPRFLNIILRIHQVIITKKTFNKNHGCFTSGHRQCQPLSQPCLCHITVFKYAPLSSHPHLFHSLLQVLVVLLHLFPPAVQGLDVVVQLHHLAQLCVDVHLPVLEREKQYTS